MSMDARAPSSLSTALVDPTAAPTPALVRVALRRSGVVYTACILAAWLFAPFTSYSSPVRVTLGTFFALASVLAVVSWRRQPPVTLTIAALLAAVALYVAGGLTHPAPSPTLGALLLGYLLLTITALIPRHQIAVAVAAMVPVLWIESRGPLDVATAQSLGPALAIAVAVLACLPVATAAGERLQRSAEELARAERRAADEEGRLSAHREAQAILHDDVLAALRMVASPEVARADAEAAARGAWEALVSTAEPEEETRDLLVALRTLRVPGLTLAFTAISDVERAMLPTDVVRAIRRAAGEALRNVVRHAGVREASIEVHVRGGAVSVAVEDEGRGFEVTHGGGSFGLRQSVLLRLTGVGGHAAVESTPGSGTRVLLTWNPPQQEEALDRAALAEAAAGAFARTIGDTRRVAAAMIGPFAALALLYGLIGVTRGGQPPWLLAWALALIGLGGYLLARGERSISPPWHELLHLLALGGVAAYLLVAPADILVTYQGWPISLAALSAAITGALRNGWRAFGVTAGLVVCIVTFALVRASGSPLAELVAAIPALLSVAWPLILTTSMRYGLTVISDRESREAARTRGTLALEAATVRRRTALDQRLSHLRTLLDTTLGAIARGEREVSEASVQRAAGIAERVARDELNLPWALTPALNRAVAAARARGVEVVITTTSDLVRTPEIASALLAAMLATPAHRIALTVTSDSAPVTVVAEIDDDDARARAMEKAAELGAQARAVGSTLIARDAPSADSDPSSP